MKELYKSLYVGPDTDVQKAKDRGYAIVSACKDGPVSHRILLGYESMGAPKGPEYLVAERKNHLYLNLVDADTPDFIPDKVIDAALAFIKENLSKDKSVFVHCNAGLSRSPSIIFLYLYKEGKLPAETHKALRTFRQLYPDYDPSNGMKLYVNRRMRDLKSQR